MEYFDNEDRGSLVRLGRELNHRRASLEIGPALAGYRERYTFEVEHSRGRRVSIRAQVFDPGLLSA